MKRSITLVSLAFGSLVLTLTGATVAILYLMFTTPDDNIRKEGLFGSVFFQTRTPVPDGATHLSVGINNPVPLIIIWVVVFGFLLLVARMYNQLKQHRENLLASTASE
jgi:hypothetical protein